MKIWQIMNNYRKSTTVILLIYLRDVARTEGTNPNEHGKRAVFSGYECRVCVQSVVIIIFANLSIFPSYFHTWTHTERVQVLLDTLGHLPTNVSTRWHVLLLNFDQSWVASGVGLQRMLPPQGLLLNLSRHCCKLIQSIIDILIIGLS